MANVVVTQSMAANDKKYDPYFDLIMNDDLAENRWPKVLDDFKEDKKHSLMADIMSKELFNKLKDLKTKPGGWTIARAINTGVCNPSSFVGCHAGDLESYHLFHELFYPLIETYHVGYKLDGSMKQKTDMDAENLSTSLTDSALDKLVSTRIRCARNLEMFPLNTESSLEDRVKLADMMASVFTKISEDPELTDFAGTFYRHESMTPEEMQQLTDDHFLFKGKDKMQASSGYHRFWPNGRGIYCSKDKKFLVWVNEGDHLRIISMQNRGSVKNVFAQFSKGVNIIETLLKKETGNGSVFLTDPILGSITCCPTNLGTGIRASVHLLIPKLIKSIGFEEIDAIAKTMNCQARGSSGEHSDVIDRVDISNLRRLGMSERELVEDMIKCANALAKMEDEVVE